MKKKQYLCLVLWTNVIFVPLVITAEHTHARHRRRINQNEYESNYIQDVPESSSATYNSFIINADDAYTPSPFPKETLTTYTTFNERQSPSASYQQKTPSSNFNHYTPGLNLERKYTEKESRYKKEGKHNTNNEKEYGYILTAGGKENIYEEDPANGYKPLEFQVAYPDNKFESERIVEQKSPAYTSGKRVSNYEKSYKYRHSYTKNNNDNSVKIDTKRTPLKLDDQNVRKDVPKARSFGVTDKQQTHQNYQLNQKLTDDFGQKIVGWRQLGPNVEISASQETPLYTRAPEIPMEKARKMYKKRQKNTMKGMRTGYMMPQHALYVSNNLQNSKPIKAIFDHNNVIKQSDKFEITDAMFNELKEENAKKSNEHKVRTKQESPKDQPYNFESPEHQSYQFYNPPLPQYYNVPAPFQSNKLASAAGLSKSFVRDIEVETNPAGVKKTITALIIPLTQDQLNSPYFNAETLSAAITSSIDIMMHKAKPQIPFPYDMVNNKFAQNEPIAGLPFDNYQFQSILPYQQFKTGNTFEEHYNPYVNFQNQNLIPRYSYSLNTPSPTAANNQDAKPTPEDTYDTQQLYQNQDQRSNLPFSIVIPNKKADSRNAAKNDFKASEYYEEGNEEAKYISPSETNNFFSVVNDPKNSRNSSQPFEKSETRRN